MRARGVFGFHGILHHVVHMNCYAYSGSFNFKTLGTWPAQGYGVLTSLQY